MVRSGRWRAALLSGLLGISACTAGTGAAPGTSTRSLSAPTAVHGPPSPWPGDRLEVGFLRTAVEDFGFTDSLDPVGETSRLGMALESQLLVRTLVTYRHERGPAGLRPVADLATNTGHVSADGLVWTFHLKSGVRFGPPANRGITSADVEYAFRRLDTPGLQPEVRALGIQPVSSSFSYLFDGLVDGMNGPQDAMPKDISGVGTPDPRTVVFHLTHPAGDFLHRLAVPAAGPVPEEVAGCLRKAGRYGRDLVSSGPYAFRGAGAVDASSCRTLEPMAGFRPTRDLALVRNPGYDPATDSPLVRENLPGRIDVRIDTSPDDILLKVDRGELDATLGIFGVPMVPGPHSYTVRWEPLAALQYLPMNVLVPPFDDVHVRRAVNLVLNREAILRAFGPYARGPMAAGLFPRSLTGRAPVPLPPRGALARARREMTLSRYDSNGDGICDATVCGTILFIHPTTPPEVNASPVIEEELDRLGIDLITRELDTGTAYTTTQTVKNLIPISLQRPLFPQYADPYSIARSLHSSGISCEDQINYSEVGITQEWAAECGVLREWRAVHRDIPNLDSRIDACEALAGGARSSCWIEFGDYVMREVVPWAPLRFPDTPIVTGRNVTKFQFDQAFGTLSLCHVAVAGPGA